MHNRKLLRLPGFDYSSNRYYFVTFCVERRIKTFGLITDKVMNLSDDGIIASEQLNWLGSQYPYIKVISSVIMPDHVHTIIYINPDYYVDDSNNNSPDVLPDNCVPRNTGLPPDKIDCMKYPKIKPLPEIVGAYKTTVSKKIHLAGNIWFKWQKSYYDHIIRNERELARIIKYIEKNPENWKKSSSNR